jgi:pSer/pThr/pTyr-binding forkhead associated (FHA) protein
MPKMNKIDQLENLAERLAEGTFARLFAGRISPMKVALHLERAIEEHQVCVPGDAAQAPTEYWVYLNPQDFQALAAQGDRGQGEMPAEQALARHITELVSETDLALQSPPTVHIQPSEDVPVRDVRVEARWVRPESDLERTREMSTRDPDELEEETPLPSGPPGHPFLIVDGKRHVDLSQPTVSIGRALDNDVIIEDPRVSRHHAQIRQRYGHLVLYDLDSSGGTQINGYPVNECVLHSGDVISFAGVEVIYGEDPPTPIPLPPDEETPVLTQSDMTTDAESGA